MTRDASGGQANRTGAYGEVPRPAETCSQASPRWWTPLACRTGEVAVGDEGTEAGQAELAAVGVAGEDERDVVGCHAVDDSQVRRVGDADRQVGRRVRRTSDVVVAVETEVGVVGADEVDGSAGDLERGARGCRGRSSPAASRPSRRSSPRQWFDRRPSAAPGVWK